jgi:hypothetical protein
MFNPIQVEARPYGRVSGASLLVLERNDATD